MIKFLYKLPERTWLILTVIAIAACQSQVEKPKESAYNKFDDSIIVEIYDHQDRRNTNALLSFFNSDNEKYRKEAALAFGSIQDSAAIPMLGHLLNDGSPKVRRAAAYALGQSYDSSAVKPLALALQSEDSLFVRRELYEALGKVITQPQIALLYQQPDVSIEEKEGMAWGLYRAGLRNVHDPSTVELAVSYLDSVNSYETRLAAANFVARTRNIDLVPHKQAVLRSAKGDPIANIRMSAVLALQKMQTPDVKSTLLQIANSDKDYRVRVSSLRSLAAFEFDEEIRQAVIEALNDENINVAITAANIIETNATAVNDLKEIALSNDNYRVRASLLGTALRLSDDKGNMLDSIQNTYEQSKNPYLKAALLEALGSTLQAYQFIITKTFSEDHPAISTAGINALAKLRAREDFPEELKSAFADIFVQAIESADIAMVAITSELLSNPEYGFKEEFDSISFLYKAKEKLSLPKDNEALQVLNNTIAYFEGKDELPETKNEYNHPIDWELVKTIKKDQTVTLKTEKGDIVLRLFIEDAPGSVANFIKLVQDNYFNDKNFHRVVPNFVIQGGCNRGDGYGGEDYSIRSEFANLRYQEGSVGMASAGKDTEGTQWFITHSPTPHLDGRYTIFAQVTDGMDVVHQMEVGDKIKSVELM